MSDSIVNWVRNWLTGRKQRVTVEGGKSSWATVHSGVPQGSVIGPLIFLIYINDLEDTVGSNILKLADGTNLKKKVRPGQDSHVLQEDLDSLVRWSEKWQMLFNQDKCKCLHIG